MPPLTGRASVEGTARYRDRSVRDRRFPPEHFRTTREGLSLTSLGLGTYLGASDAATDRAVEEAVRASLASGRVNVVDTAINYRSQRAERSVGRALARLVKDGGLARDELFVATKNGYLAPDGESGIDPARWIDEELIRPRRLDPKDVVGGSHAMSPSYLRDQFDRSRRNLGVETIDLLYLHNAADAQLPSVGRERFLARLEEAFRLYEGFRAAGSLSTYGLATWDSLREPPAYPSYLALEEVVRVARAVGGPHHGFRFVQFPFNLAMPEAARNRNQPVGSEYHDLFSAAAELEVGCFTSVPLFQGQLVRAGPRRDGLTAAQTALQFARSAPGNLAPLVGQKSPEHVGENLEVASRPPWDPEDFRGLLAGT